MLGSDSAIIMGLPNMYVCIYAHMSAPCLARPPYRVRASMHPGVLSATGSGDRSPPLFAREETRCWAQGSAPLSHLATLGSSGPFPALSRWPAMGLPYRENMPGSPYTACLLGAHVPRTGCMEACIRGSSRLPAQGTVIPPCSPERKPSAGHRALHPCHTWLRWELPIRKEHAGEFLYSMFSGTPCICREHAGASLYGMLS